MDIGGGFPGLKKDFELFKQMSADIEETLKKLTAGYPALKVIAEPGIVNITANSQLVFITTVLCRTLLLLLYSHTGSRHHQQAKL